MKITSLFPPLARKILVVHADPIVANAQESSLNQCGFAVVHADCAYQVSIELTLHNFDLLLISYELPDDAIELTRTIRRTPGLNQHRRIFAITEDFSLEKEQACLRAGIVRLLEAPLTRAVARAIVPMQLIL
jgi:two-component system, OmpR family, sensor histidine kinase TorS